MDQRAHYEGLKSAKATGDFAPEPAPFVSQPERVMDVTRRLRLLVTRVETVSAALSGGVHDSLLKRNPDATPREVAAPMTFLLNGLELALGELELALTPAESELGLG